jgi:hypothetical protein
MAQMPIPSVTLPFSQAPLLSEHDHEESSEGNLDF